MKVGCVVVVGNGRWNAVVMLELVVWWQCLICIFFSKSSLPVLP